MKAQHFVFILFFTCKIIFAQVGGESSFEYLTLPSSARAIGLGGNLIGTYDTDISLAYHNPSLLHKRMHNTLSLGTVIHNRINYGTISYARFFERIRTTFHFGAKYLTYGNFVRRDEIGNDLGNFGGDEHILFASGSHRIKRFTFGATLKFLIGHLDRSTAFGIASDLGITYDLPEKRFAFSFLFKNMGGQIKAYTGKNREPLPFDLQFGFSKGFKHIPLLIHVAIHDLYRWDIRYANPNNTSTNGGLFGQDLSTAQKAAIVVDNLFRHFIFSGEFNIKEKVRFGLGYNHQQRFELRFPQRKGAAGMSFLLGLNIKSILFDYGLAFYSSVGSTHAFTFSIDLNKIRKKRLAKKSTSNKKK